MNFNRFTPTAASTAARIGQLVENNLTNWATAAKAELVLAEHAGDDPAPLLSLGVSLLKCRQVLRESIHRAELKKWGARA